MNNYRIRMLVELDGTAESDLEIEKAVQAASEGEALDRARQLVKTENPDVNAAKIWSWAIQRTRG